MSTQTKHKIVLLTDVQQAKCCRGCIPSPSQIASRGCMLVARVERRSPAEPCSQPQPSAPRQRRGPVRRRSWHRVSAEQTRTPTTKKTVHIHCCAQLYIHIYISGKHKQQAAETVRKSDPTATRGARRARKNRGGVGEEHCVRGRTHADANAPQMSFSLSTNSCVGGGGGGRSEERRVGKECC